VPNPVKLVKQSNKYTITYKENTLMNKSMRRSKDAVSELISTVDEISGKSFEGKDGGLDKSIKEVINKLNKKISKFGKKVKLVDVSNKERGTIFFRKKYLFISSGY